MDERTSVRLIEALARVWAKIRSYHPKVPPVVILAAPAHRDQLNVLGHFSALRWSARKKEGQHLHEVVVVAEHLDRPAEEIAETLLHEAAHALNFERQIHDCSATSQYHNLKFKEAAEELGLDVIQIRNYGFALTALPKATARRYAEEIAFLKKVLIHRRKLATLPRGPAPPGTAGVDDEGGDKPRSRLRKAVCACRPPFIIRVAKKTIEDTVIRCDSCGEPFRLT